MWCYGQCTASLNGSGSSEGFQMLASAHVLCLPTIEVQVFQMEVGIQILEVDLGVSVVLLEMSIEDKKKLKYSRMRNTECGGDAECLIEG